MIAVVFEVWPKPGQEQQYLDRAARLKPELEKIDGFISVERFASLSDEGKILSLSLWRDEDAVARWRNNFVHKEAQDIGKSMLFKDYRIRVASILRDYGMFDRTEVPSP